ncbi:class I SAM-dependent methyltransferase [Bradyrhizobium sp. SZCCHNRI2049]|uniref:class I SAM-dependent methyltransferase n=1 Tax=Bradyrhizobium sp. SZCCHNRI2049 TaxID=3057287 RepID=UPI0029167911|nr:methyltransferase domain-containing protein [Bradyrhizobium sp. SZCCHNRI2049]
MRLNLGCGRDVKPGWINVDREPAPDVVAFDLGRCRDLALPFSDETVDEILASHVIEHIVDTLPLMQELHRVARPDALMTIRVPYGSSDEAWEDPTHVRAYTLGSFGYFGQPHYWRADYLYRGDWSVETIWLAISDEFKGESAERIMGRVKRERNVVTEMVAQLRAVKPARAADRALQTVPTVRLSFV